MTNSFSRLTLIMIATLLLSACSKPISVNIPFALTYHNQPVSCGQFGQANPAIKLKDFRFYLHHVELQNKQGDWSALTLDQNNQWQTATTALLDFENAADQCKLGNEAINNQLAGTLPNAQYHAIRFVIGVPFELNHQNPLIAKAPLNESSMHWHWQGGYKFVRAEFSINDQPRRLHIGSLQCKGEIGAISHCEKPNRVEVQLNNFAPLTSTINISLDSLIDFKDVDEQAKLTCMGGTAIPWCANALSWIGLTDNNQQTAFSTTSKKVKKIL